MVEARAHVLERDHVRELDELALVEALAQRREEVLVDDGGRPAHRDRVIQHEPLELIELLAVPIARQGEHLLLAHPGRAREVRADVAAELAAHHRRRLQLRERLQVLGYLLLRGGRLLEGAVAQQQARRVRVHADRVRIAPDLAPRHAIDEAHERSGAVRGHGFDARHCRFLL